MFREPTKGDLQSSAGWTLVERLSTTPEHVVALDKYRDGCEALIPFAKDGTADAAQEGEVKLPAQSAPPSRLIQIVAAPPVQRQVDGCEHKFGMYDQRCKFCKATKFQALAQRGRKPELIEQ